MEKKVLIVEDEEGTRKYVRFVLEQNKTVSPFMKLTVGKKHWNWCPAYSLTSCFWM